MWNKKNHSANIYQNLLWYYVMDKAALIADLRKKKPAEPNPITTLRVIWQGYMYRGSSEQWEGWLM